MESNATPPNPDASRKLSQSNPEACDRVIQAAAEQARALAKSRELNPIFVGATIVVGPKEFAKRGELDRRVSAGELIKLGPLNYREATTAERLEREARIARNRLEASDQDAWRIKAGRDAAAEQMRRRAESLFAESACPRRHIIDIETVDENVRWIDTRDLIVSQTLRFRGFLVALLGPSGTGKTQLAVNVIHRVCQYGLTARYVKALELFRDFRSAYRSVEKGDASISEEEIAEKWIGYGLLVIDEAHLRAGTEFEQRTLVNMLDRRYDDMRATVLIANQGKQEFSEQVGPSIVSRIHQTGEAILCDWPSYRKPGSWREGGAL